MSEENFKVFRVTLTHDFLVPEYMHQSPGFDKILEEEWFGKYVGSYHATRDAHEIGNSQKFVELKEIPIEQLKAESEQRERRRMYPLQEKIKADMITAMKARETEKRDSLKLVISEMQRQPTKDLEDSKVVKIITTMIKGAKETLAMVDVDAETTPFIQLLESYLPEPADKNDVILWIHNNIDFSQYKNKMQAMKPIMNHFGSTVDGNMVKEILNTIEV